jgi:hypothetical protein
MLCLNAVPPPDNLDAPRLVRWLPVMELRLLPDPPPISKAEGGLILFCDGELIVGCRARTARCWVQLRLSEQLVTPKWNALTWVCFHLRQGNVWHSGKHHYLSPPQQRHHTSIRSCILYMKINLAATHRYICGDDYATMCLFICLSMSLDVYTITTDFSFLESFYISDPWKFKSMFLMMNFLPQQLNI